MPFYKLPPLIKATFIKRYKRFLVDVHLNNKVVTVHCPNPGSMLGLLDTGSTVFISKSQNPHRKLPYTLECIQTRNGSLVGINTMRANDIVYHALQNNLLNETIPHITNIKREPLITQGVRFDFLVSTPHENIFIEVKNVTLKEESHALFPDSVTTRGTKHAHHLALHASSGKKCLLLFLVQRCDCTAFSLARTIDPIYAQAVQEAQHKGVLIQAHSCTIGTDKGILFHKKSMPLSF